MSRTWKTVALCALSGIVCGLMTAAECRRVESGCQIAPIQSIFSDPVSWTVWLYWVNWLPGLVFGALFAIPSAVAAPAAHRVRRIAAYALSSAAAYLVAGLLFFLILSHGSANEFDALIWVWPAALTAGLFGALGLALAASAVLSTSREPGRRFRRFGLPALVGAIMGLAFAGVCIYGEQNILVAWPVAFALWQVTVGLALLRASA
jgi:hypothetical protein